MKQNPKTSLLVFDKGTGGKKVSVGKNGILLEVSGSVGDGEATLKILGVKKTNTDIISQNTKLGGAENVEINLQSLTDISILVSEIINDKKYSFFAIDTLGSILESNKPETVKRFIRYLLNKFQRYGIELILIVEGNQQETEVLESFKTTRR